MPLARAADPVRPMSEFARTQMLKYAHVKPSGHKEEWPEIASRVVGSIVRPHLPALAPRLLPLVEHRKFVPAGRYLYAAGRRDQFISNCFLFRADDSRQGWAELASDCMSSLMAGGGIGVVYSDVRPSDCLLGGLGGRSTGPVSLMKVINEQGRYVRQGGSRRSAIWAGLHWNHPDVFEFISCKRYTDLYRRVKAEDPDFPLPMDTTNVSVILDDDFFAAYHDPLFRATYRWGPGGKFSHRVDNGWARDVYWASVRGMLIHGEPGFSVDIGENAGENERNACLSGDTLVATVAGPMPISHLAGKRVEVFSCDASGAVKTGVLRSVRVTRRNAALVKVTLDDGSSVRLTDDHRVMMLDGSFREAGTLSPGDKLMPFWSKVRQKYRWVGCRRGGRKVCWLKTGRERDLKDGLDVHHLNGDTLDDRRDNLSVMPHGRHAAEKMYGADNPAVRLGHDEGWRIRKSVASTGRRNGRYTDGSRVRPRALAALHGSISPSRTWEKTCEWCGNAFLARRPTTKVCSKSCSGHAGARGRMPSRSGRSVVSVEPAGFEDVYDGTVDGLHCFAIVTKAGDGRSGTHLGMVVHNCCEATSRDHGDQCCLGTLNMARFSSLDEFGEACELAAAFLVCGTLAGLLPVEKMYRVREKNRRIGLGLMGVHEWLLRRGKRYGPDAELEEWLRVYAQATAFAHRHEDKLGISRSVATRSIAPNGTIGIVAETTTSGEPIPYVAYRRRYHKDGRTAWQYVIDPTAKQLIEEGADPALIETSLTLADDVGRRMETQAWLQRFVDQGISSTVNLPAWGGPLNNEQNVTKFGDTLLAHLPGLRGICAYPDGGRDGQPIEPVPYEEALGKEGVEYIDGASDLYCRNGGVCGS